MKIEMSGQCLRCAERTTWRVCEGWAFHTYTKHWRCSICNCLTQPHLYVNAGMLAKIERQEAARHEVVMEIAL